MPWIIPAFIAGSSVVSGKLGADAAEDASDASSQATRAAIDENRRQYDTTREDTAPYRDVSQQTLYRLADIFGVSSPEARATETAQKDSQAELSALLHNTEVASKRAAELEKKISQYNSIKQQWRGSGLGGSLKKNEYDAAVNELSSLKNNIASNDARIAALNTQPANEVRRYTSSQKSTPESPAPSSSSSIFGDTKLDVRRLYDDISELKVKGLYDNLEMDPGYQFRLSEGEKALQRQQSAGGTRYGGAALKAAARYGQDYASGEFRNAVDRRNFELGHAVNERNFAVNNRNAEIGFAADERNFNLNKRNAELGYLFSLAGFGPQGIATAGQAGANSAGNTSSILMQNATNQGNAAISGASAINNAVQGGIQNYYTNSLLKNYNRMPVGQPTSTSNYGVWS